jgi:hypothetical protein
VSQSRFEQSLPEYKLEALLLEPTCSFKHLSCFIISDDSFSRHFLTDTTYQFLTTDNYEILRRARTHAHQDIYS